jgi:hypothetical protein
MKNIVATLTAFLCLISSSHAFKLDIHEKNVSATDVQQIIVRCLGSKMQVQLGKFMWPDAEYSSITADEMQSVATKISRTVRRYGWDGETFDCDDAAVLFKAELIKMARKSRLSKPFCAGYISIGRDMDSHAMIWFVDSNADLWFIEPITGYMHHWSAFDEAKYVFFVMG